MSRHIDHLKHEVERFTESPATKTAVDAIFSALEVEAKARGRYEAFIQIGEIDEKTIDLPDEGYGEDWEVLTGSFRYTDAEGDEVSVDCHANQYQEMVDNLTQQFEEQESDLENEISELEDEIDEIQEIIDEMEEERDSLDADEDDDEQANEIGRQIQDQERELQRVADKQSDAEKKLKAVEEALYTLRRTDFEPSEIYWNTLYQYNGTVDADAALRVGLEVVRVGDEEYLGLSGCGMDLSPKFFVYQALAHGYVSERMSGKLRSNGPNYFKYVVPKDAFDEAMKVLGIEEFVDATEAELAERMKKFDKRIADISEAMKSGGINKELGAIGALMALSESMNG